MTKDNAIGSITDKDWASTNELGTIEEVVEYFSGEERKKVKLVAHVLSGAELDAIESRYTSMDMATGQFNVDSQGYNDAKLCAVFKIDRDTLQSIYKNKSADLRTKMLLMANRATGANSIVEEIEKEKNVESPEA